MYSKEYYLNRKAMHVCVGCGKQDERTVRGLTLCGMCYEKGKEKRKARARALYADRKAWGLCALCGKKDAYIISGRVLCAECCKKEAERQHSRREKRLA